MNTRYNILPNFTILIIDDIGFIGGLFVDELNNMNSLHNINIKLVIPMKVARLAQTFGYGTDSNDSRVFAQFARAAYENKDIVLHTKGLSMGNYCESKDDINTLLIILNHGQDGEVYNVVNEENTMSIHDMANLVAKK